MDSVCWVKLNDISNNLSSTHRVFHSRAARRRFLLIFLGAQVFVGLHLLVTRQEGVLFLKDQGVLVQEIASVRVRHCCQLI